VVPADKQKEGGAGAAFAAQRRQNDTTPKSISRMTILSGTPSNQRMIGIVASWYRLGSTSKPRPRGLVPSISAERNHEAGGNPI
jgi:hypothetical protein